MTGPTLLKVYPSWYTTGGKPEPIGTPQFLNFSSVIRIEPWPNGWCALHTAQWGTYYALTVELQAQVELSLV